MVQHGISRHVRKVDSSGRTLLMIASPRALHMGSSPATILLRTSDRPIGVVVLP